MIVIAYDFFHELLKVTKRIAKGPALGGSAVGGRRASGGAESFAMGADSCATGF